MFQKTFRTRSHEEFMASLTELTAKAKADTLYAAELSGAIGKYYDDGDYIDQSFGTSWILKNPQLFAKVIPGPYRLVFLMNHLDRPHCSELFICSEGVLNTLTTQEERNTYVREAYIRNGARNNSWVATALKVGVPKELIFFALSTRLRQTPAEDPERNYASPFYDFLSHGDSGSRGHAEHSRWAEDVDDPACWEVPADSPWGICTYNEFYSLVWECADKAPKRVFDHWRKLSAKLGIDDVKRILAQAVTHFKVITGDVEAWLKLDQTTRENALRTLKSGDGVIFTKLMIHTVLSASDSRKLNEEISENVVTVDPLTMYLTAKPILAEVKDAPSMWLRLLIQMRLQTAGYVIGRVQEGTYTDKRRQETRRQFFVETLDGSRYIPDRGYTSRRYYPSVGDEVIFHPNKVIRRLTPKVFTVGFIPVDESKRR